MSTASARPPKLNKKSFASDQEVRWCPGCGDYAILNAVQTVFAELEVPREKFVIISGIGCSSRFPYYMNTYGFHSIHGRAPGIATGLKISRPDLDVWVVTGDGDGLSIGGNHLIHAMRRNVNIKILMFNNRIYGLTKGQFSPTSEFGKKTKSTPFGSVDRPFNPTSVALGAEATFVARSVDIYQSHLKDCVRRAHQHKGSAFVEIYQNCNIFNDGAFEFMTAREARSENQIYMEHGKPLVFGKEHDKGIRVRNLDPEVVRLDEVDESDLLVHDEKHRESTMAFLLSRLTPPEFPTALGVFRAIEAPTYEEAMNAQLARVRQRLGEPDLDEILMAGDTWKVPG
jgi:2-oxoglutarate ferredoxin oxidoreductase subunit beta